MDTSTQLDIPIQVGEAPAELLPAISEADNTFALPALTREESDFALAIIEYGGNITAAVKVVFGDGVHYPKALGHEILARPQVAAKIAQLQAATKEHSLISVGSHLDELARIRDLAILTANVKVAMNAERSRGEVAGFYQRHENPKGNNNVQININMASKHDENI